MSANFILLYISTVFIATILPGPSMLLALTHGLQFGAKRTIASAMGNVTISLVQASISVAGLGTILIASEAAFQAVKLGGAAYLIYMKIGILFSPKMSVVSENNSQTQNEVSLRKMYLQAAIVAVGNPKSFIFLRRSSLNSLIPNLPIYRYSVCY